MFIFCGFVNKHQHARIRISSNMVHVDCLQHFISFIGEGGDDLATNAKLLEGTIDGRNSCVNATFEPQLILQFIKIKQSTMIQKSGKESDISLTERMGMAHST
jgi:hypothetical protein